MKKSLVVRILLSVLIILLLSIGVLVSRLSQKSAMLSPPFELPSITSCDQIPVVWNIVFNNTFVNSSNLTISYDTIMQNKCTAYYAYKRVGNMTFVLAGSDLNITDEEGNVTERIIIMAAAGEFTPLAHVLIETYANQIEGDSAVHLGGPFSMFYGALFYAFPRTAQIASPAEAEYEYNTIFAVKNASAFIYYQTPLDHYLARYDDQGGIARNLKAAVVVNRIAVFFQAVQQNESLAEIIPCIPNWQSENTSCTNQEIFTTFYTDANACLGLEPPTNQTYDCDYEGNGLIGLVSSIVDKNLEVDLYINNSEVNFSRMYGGELNVELRDEHDIIRVEFNHNFSVPLNLRRIEVKIQPPSTTRGSIIANGMANEKTVRINKKDLHSNSVCIKDREIDSISDISDGCDATSEELLSCPGTGDDFECAIDSDLFIVSGLENSAVLEFLEQPQNATCSPAWNCTFWQPGECPENETQTRTCTDSNTCNTTAGKPPETQSCTYNCIPDWECTGWQPGECPDNGKRTRTCADANSCGVTQGKPSEDQTCQYESSKFISRKVAVIIVIVILASGILVTLVILIRKLIEPAKETYPRISIQTQQKQR